MSKNVNLFILFQATPIPGLIIKPRPEKLPYVEIIPMYAGTNGTLIKSAVAAGAKEIVIQAGMRKRQHPDIRSDQRGDVPGRPQTWPRMFQVLLALEMWEKTNCGWKDMGDADLGQATFPEMDD